jgi:hypothetical protein
LPLPDFVFNRIGMAILLSNTNFGMPSGERRRFQLIFCYCLDREMDFLLIPFINPALILFYTPLDATEMAFIRPLLHLCKRSFLRISPNSGYADNADRVDNTHIVFRHVYPFAILERAKEKNALQARDALVL